MTGPLAGLDYGFTAIFAVAAATAVFAMVVVSAFLPRHSGPDAGRGGLGAALVWAAAGSTLALVVMLIYSAGLLPLSVAVVVAGLAVLGTPFLVEPIPRAIRESRLALVAILLLVTGCVLALPVTWST